MNRSIAILALLGTACGGDGGTEPAPQASLAGIVREAATSAPIAGAVVRIETISVTTDQDGRFAVQGVPVGNSMWVVVSAPRFDPYSEAISIQPGPNSHDITLDAKTFYENGDILVHLPREVTTYRGILFTLLGGDYDARPLLRGDMDPYQDWPSPEYLVRYREAMIDFARTHSFALLGTQTVSGGQWSEGGSAAILNSLRAIATESGRPELAEAPLLLNGHSYGACASLDFSMEHPQRVIGYIFSKAAACLVDLDASRALSVPAYFFAGRDDPLAPNAEYMILEAFDKHRPRGALWAMALDDSTGHAMVANIDLLFDWMAEVTRLRLPETSSGSAPVQLQSLAEATGWLGHPQTFAIAEYRCLADLSPPASWLPSLATARDWQALASLGSVTELASC
jgi:pimeloyl-ACP methyl ester carboxylesterase